MVKFIAEVSSNHAQDLDRSLAFVDAAADCGFDAVKFQLFRVAELFAPEILAKSPQHSKRVAWELPLAHLEPHRQPLPRKEHRILLHAFLSGSGEAA